MKFVTVALFATFLLVIVSFHLSEAKKGGSSSRGSSSKGSSSKGSSSKGTYSNVGSSSSSSYGSSNKGIGGGYSGGSSSSYGSKSKGIMSNKVVKTATKVAGAYVAYKVARKGVKYAGKGLKYSAFGGGGWHPYRYRMGYYRPPIFVPVGRYRDRHYYSNYNQERLLCYVCEGQDNDPCVTRPTAGGATRIQCPYNHYCAVIRKEHPPSLNATILPSNDTRVELELVDGPVPSESRCDVYVSQGVPVGVDPDYWINLIAGTGCKLRRRRKPSSSEVIEIQRLCKPIESLDDGAGLSARSTNLGFDSNAPKVYTTYCTTELCNTGDGRLRCYACDGFGVDDACMIEPVNVSRIATCEPNEFCHILRTVTMLNSTEEDDGPVNVVMNVTRSCKPYSSSDDDFEVNVGEDIVSGMATLSCASDLCNSMDAHMLSQPLEEVNSVSGLTHSLTVTCVTILFAFLLI